MTELSNERAKSMIVGIVVVLVLHVLIGVIVSVQTITPTPVIIPYWCAPIIDLIAIGMIGVMGVFGEWQ
jgi:hypothetical protein